MQDRQIKAIVFVIAMILLSYLIFYRIEGDTLLLLNNLESNRLLYSLLNISLLTLDAILPIPSSILMFLNGKVLGILGGTSLSICGASLGSLIAYKIGYKSNDLMNKKDHYNISQNLLNNYGIWTIMVTRAIPVISELIIIYAGIKKYKLRSVLIYATLGYVPVCLVYAVLGSIMFQTKGFFIALFSSTVFSLLTIIFVFLNKKTEYTS